MDFRVSTEEFIKDFSSFAARALTEPVIITQNGGDQLVVLSVEEYWRLKRRDRKVYRAEDIPDELVTAIASAEAPPESWAVEREIEERRAPRNADLSTRHSAFALQARMTRVQQG
jgi:PHD/YefM family antitoxin component YafN of YafNO toxin-antitoxin module